MKKLVVALCMIVVVGIGIGAIAQEAIELEPKPYDGMVVEYDGVDTTVGDLRAEFGDYNAETVACGGILVAIVPNPVSPHEAMLVCTWLQHPDCSIEFMGCN